jgi:hypothetical protein
MAVYKLFPEKDATLYSLLPSMNTGLDSQLESSATAFAPTDPNPQVSRFLIQFNDIEMGSVLDNLVQDQNGTDWKAFLRFYSSKATGLTTDTTIDIHLAAKSWDNGTGLYLDQPITTNGTSWIWTDRSGSNKWIENSSDTGNNIAKWTGSYNPLYAHPGGGQWVYSSSRSDIWSLSSSVTFSYRSALDVNTDVTELVYHWVGYGSHSIDELQPTGSDWFNYGFLIKLTGSQEFQPSKDITPELKFFSVDTATIYPPQLEFRWDDFTWSTSSLSVLSTSTPYVSLAENPGTFNQDAVNRFRVYSRPEYPTRTFTTSSLYTTNHYLPEGSTWAIKDLDTNEFVINFDNNYTKLSADSTSCYFDVYMNGLEPERYYKIMISSSIDGSQQIFDDKYYFKVING